MMDSENTVYIIGAGASAEINMPTGAELLKAISKLLNIKFSHGSREPTSGDYQIYRILEDIAEKRREKFNDLRRKSCLVSSAIPLAISIDNYIDAHREDDIVRLCGKLAIVRSILDAERSGYEGKGNPLYLISEDSEKCYYRLNDTWYLSFFQLITENCTFEELEYRFKKITLIVFNYDRCVEQFLVHAIVAYYGVYLQQAATMLRNMKIFHPYGSVGVLDVLRDAADKDQIPVEFGAESFDNSTACRLSKQISTFTEGRENERIQMAMGNARRVVFLGFAFHELNMKLLKIFECPKHSCEVNCYATAYGLSENDRRVIAGHISKLYEGFGRDYVVAENVNFSNCKCMEFFREYWKSLGFTKK